MPNSEKTLMRILVVDDTSLVRQLVLVNLKSLGFTDMDEANDGKSAHLKLRQALADNKPFHMVLCDWNMPGVDGMGLLTLCRESKEFEKLPFIMITAEGGQKKIFEALAMGSTDYIVKPFSPETLKKKVLKLSENLRTKAS